MKRALLAAALLLSGCEHAAGAVAVCPPVTPYTAGQLAAVNQAQALLPDDSPILPVLEDWVRLRDAARACAGAKP
jgi:hypothetical protein